MTVDLGTDYLGLGLRSPLVASAGPLTGHLDSLLALEAAGAAAVVLPSLFEEEIVRDSLAIDDVLERGTNSFGESLDFFPELDDYGTGPDRYLERLGAAKEALSIPVIASLNAITPGGWVRHARLLEQSGADAIELNVYTVPTDARRPAAEVEDEALTLVSEVRAAVSVPLAVKLGPYYSSFAHFARRVQDAGADGLVLFNRFYQPDLDLETLDVAPTIELSHPWELRLPLRWIALLRPMLSCSLAATSGVADARGVLKALLVGADVAMMTSALLRHGPDHLRSVEAGVRQWMEEGEYASVRQLRGSVSHAGAEDPQGFERANYMRVLDAWEAAATLPGASGGVGDAVEGG